MTLDIKDVKINNSPSNSPKAYHMASSLVFAMGSERKSSPSAKP